MKASFSTIFRAAIAATLVFVAGPGTAQVASDPLGPFAGRTIRFIIGDGPGDESDIYGRALAEALRRLLPQTAIFAQNLEGAGGALALVEALQADGETIVLAVVHGSPIYAQLGASELAVFDLDDFRWIGALANNYRLAVVRRSLGVETVAEAASLGRALLAPASTASSAGYFEALVFGAMTDLGIEPILGLTAGSRDAMMLAGDADFAINSWFGIQALLASGDLVPLVRLGIDGYPPEMEHIPTLGSVVRPGTPATLIETFDTLNRLGRLVVAPPSTDPAIVDSLRAVFDRAISDPELSAAVARHGLVLSPTSGLEVETRIHRLLGDEQSLAIFRAYLDCGMREAEEAEIDCLSE